VVVEGNLGDRLTITIDPNWPQIRLWQHPVGRTLRLTFVDFSSGVQESATPNYVNTEVIGRAEAYKAFINTQNRQITIPFRFRVQGQNTTNSRQAIFDEVINPARFLDALKYPVYDPDQGISYAPPPCLVKFGELIRPARCIVTGGDLNWLTEPVETETLLPHGCDFTAQFEVVRRIRPDLSYFPTGSSGGPISGDWQ
jgi:hypothetical protein